MISSIWYPASVNENEPKSETAAKRSRPFVGINFKCCRVYWRIYLAANGKRYSGHCPKCGFPVQVEVSQTGSDNPFFEI
ncbi:MAG: hypothetical protein JNL67_07860 [Planctomycetaceae bacterium]|nr:hypothetical protein [Planctomycetaceae bacterium]